MADDEALNVLAIQRLKARYFRFMDTKQWSSWRELFTDDLVFYIEETVMPTRTDPEIVGGDAFVEFVSGALVNMVTVHHGHMPEIEITGDRSAVGVWAMFDWCDDHVAKWAFHGYGHYHERYEKGDDGEWRIAELRLTRLRIDERPYTELPPGRPMAPGWKPAASL